MSNEFINKLENDEKILFHEFSDISKTSAEFQVETGIFAKKV